MEKSFLHSYFEALPEIEGWFSGEAALMFMAYNQLLASEGVAGNLLEIGVHHGKSAIAIAGMRAEDARLYAVDLFEEGQWENTSSSGSGERHQFIRNLERFFGSLENVEIIAGSSQQLTPDQLGRHFSFCHVDGGHSARETLLDMELCEQILLPGGLLALDDYFNECFPGVSEGAARYMVEHAGALIPIAIGFNKVLFQKSGTSLDLPRRLAETFDYIPRSPTEFWGAPTDLFLAGLSLFVDLGRSTPARFVPSETFPYPVGIEPVVSRVRAKKTDAIKVPVRVCNQSDGAFPPGTTPAGLSYHLLTPEGSVISWDNPRVALAPSLSPREERSLFVPIVVPAESGQFVVELDVVWENVTWLKDRGNQTRVIELTVTD